MTPIDGDGGEVPPAAGAEQASAPLFTDDGAAERAQDTSTATGGDPPLSQSEIPTAEDSAVTAERIEIQPDMVKFVQMPKSAYLVVEVLRNH